MRGVPERLTDPNIRIRNLMLIVSHPDVMKPTPGKKCRTKAFFNYPITNILGDPDVPRRIAVIALRAVMGVERLRTLVCPRLDGRYLRGFIPSRVRNSDWTSYHRKFIRGL